MGTNITGRMTRWAAFPSGDFSISTSACEPCGGPTGTTMRPPGFN